MGTIRVCGSAVPAMCRTVARRPPTAPATEKRTWPPGRNVPVSASGKAKRRSNGSRRSRVATSVPAWAYCPVRTSRVSTTPSMGARIAASRWSSRARSTSTSATATSARAVSTRLRQVSSSSPLTNPGLAFSAASRRARPVSASPSAARARSTRAFAERATSAKRAVSTSTSTSPRETRSPSRNRTASTAPATRAVTCTRSKGSSVPTARPEKPRVRDATVVTSTGKD